MYEQPADPTCANCGDAHAVVSLAKNSQFSAQYCILLRYHVFCAPIMHFLTM